VPIKLTVEELKEQILDQEAMIRMINEVEDSECRAKLIALYTVIIALWSYWNTTQDKDAELHIQYYQKKFFDLYFNVKEG